MRPPTKLAFWTVTLLFSSIIAAAQNVHELRITSDAPIVLIETREVAREFMQLPTLDYAIEIEQQCASDLTPAVLSLSVADTRKTYRTDEIASSAPMSIHFTVPAAQIGPIAIADFCVAEKVADESSQPEMLMIPDVLSLQASLLCASETETTIIYASASLDVALQCGPIDAKPVDDVD